MAIMWRIFITQQHISLPVWKEFGKIDVEKINQRAEKAKNIRAIRESIPDWLDKAGYEELGEAWGKGTYRAQ